MFYLMRMALTVPILPRRAGRGAVVPQALRKRSAEATLLVMLAAIFGAGDHREYRRISHPGRSIPAMAILAGSATAWFVLERSAAWTLALVGAAFAAKAVDAFGAMENAFKRGTVSRSCPSLNGNSEQQRKNESIPWALMISDAPTPPLLKLPDLMTGGCWLR